MFKKAEQFEHDGSTGQQEQPRRQEANGQHTNRSKVATNEQAFVKAWE